MISSCHEHRLGLQTRQRNAVLTADHCVDDACSPKYRFGAVRVEGLKRLTGFGIVMP